MLDFQRHSQKFLSSNFSLKSNNKNKTFSSFENHKINFPSQLEKLDLDITSIKSQLLNITKQISLLEEKSSLHSLNTGRSKNDDELEFSLSNELKEEIIDFIKNEIKSSLNEINIDNKIHKIEGRIDLLDGDFEKLVKEIQNLFSNQEKSINKLNTSKINNKEYQEQILIINKNFEEINKKLNLENNKFSYNENIEENINLKLISLKNEIENNFEKVNIKILNEIKNQTADIKNLYQEIHSIDLHNNYQTTINNLEIEEKINNNKKNKVIKNNNNTNNSLSIINKLASTLEEELAKKVNLDQLNIALETQSKLNEAFSSAYRMCRLSWGREGKLLMNKYIQWSMQNINTALDVFHYKNNSETINILQKGIYKIVVGLIDNGKGKNVAVIIGEGGEDIITIDSRKEYEKKEDLGKSLTKSNFNIRNKEKEREVKYMERFITCGDTNYIKVAIIEGKNNFSGSGNNKHEEAFLEITKII